MSELNQEIKKFRRRLPFQMLKKVSFSFFIYCISLAGIYIGAKFIFSRLWVWQADDIFYRLLKKLEFISPLVGILMAVLGLLLILMGSWIKISSYLEAVLRASEKLHTDLKDPILLPKDLKDIEVEMNRLKVEFLKADQIAKDAEVRKNEMVMYLAHDLKAPLTSVMGYLSLLKEEPQISEALKQKYLEIALEKSKRLEELINEFFDITRFNFSEEVLHKETLDLSLLVAQVGHEFEPLLQEKGLHYKISGASELKILADGQKLQRVFDNLLKNAIHYSFPDTCIEISLKRHQDKAVVSFLNQGPHMDEIQMEKIFEKFYRLDPARGAQNGSGIGLSIAREIVHRHQGQIFAQSEGQNITFTVVLPLGPSSS